MSYTSDSFSRGISTGIDLGRSIVEGRSAKGIRDANEVFAKMQSMGPGVAAPNGAIPTGEQEYDIVGYSGEGWQGLKQQYSQAMAKVSNPQYLEAMTKRLADYEHGEVMKNGRNALAAIQAGNTAAAQKFMSNISYYMSDGEAPAITVDQNGNTFIENGEQMTAMTPEDLSDYLLQIESFSDWANLTFDKKKHADTMNHYAATLAADVAYNTGRLLLMEKEGNASIARDMAASDLARVQIESEAVMAPIKLERENVLLDQAKQNLSQGKETHDLALSDHELAKIEKDRKEYTDEFEKLLKDPGNLSGSGGANENPLTGEEAAPTIASLTDAKAEEAQSFTRAARAEANARLAADPLSRPFAYALMEALRASPDNEKMTNAQIATLAYGVTMDSGTGPEATMSYDPEEHEIVLRGGLRYALDDSQKSTLQGLWGAENKEGPPPPPGGIPTE